MCPSPTKPPSKETNFPFPVRFAMKGRHQPNVAGCPGMGDGTLKPGRIGCEESPYRFPAEEVSVRCSTSKSSSLADCQRGVAELESCQRVHVMCPIERCKFSLISSPIKQLFQDDVASSSSGRAEGVPPGHRAAWHTGCIHQGSEASGAAPTTPCMANRTSRFGNLM